MRALAVCAAAAAGAAGPIGVTAVSRATRATDGAAGGTGASAGGRATLPRRAQSSVIALTGTGATLPQDLYQTAGFAYSFVDSSEGRRCGRRGRRAAGRGAHNSIPTFVQA
jgi:hypothetical protein